MNDTAPREILDACEASLRDIAEGQVFDARDVLTESQRALEAYLRAPPIIVRRGKPAKPSRAA
jgi:hypothetical protein